MSNDVLVAPSILAVWDKSGGDMEGVVAAAVAAEKAGADWIHVDVMDGQFVPAFTFGTEVVKALKKQVKVPLDVHLMVEDPETMVAEYVKAGARRIVFHPSASHDVRGCLEVIEQGGAVAGLALDVDEEVDVLEPYAKDIDQVLVMTVKAGQGGQEFRPELLEKIKAVRGMIGEKARLVVDGGVNDQTVGYALRAGADVVVAGNYVFGAKDLSEAIGNLRE